MSIYTPILYLYIYIYTYMYIYIYIIVSSDKSEVYVNFYNMHSLIENQCSVVHSRISYLNLSEDLIFPISWVKIAQIFGPKEDIVSDP